jgi:hypothetical protein
MNQYGQDVWAEAGAAGSPREYNDSPSPTPSPTEAPMSFVNQLFREGSNVMGGMA